MGKPSSYKLSRKSHHFMNISISNQKIQAPMSTQKIEMHKRKKRSKTRNKIRNLFSKLKKQNELSTSLDTNDCDSVENTPISGQKRKCYTQSFNFIKRRKSDSVILITDDDTTNANISSTSLVSPSNANVCSTTLVSPDRYTRPINCSTPINQNDSNLIQTMIKNFNNNDTVNEEIVNLTKEIHQDSYLTIDLTTDGEASKTNNTVIDLDKTDLQNDCTLVSISNASLSLSGESNVTVLQNKRVNKKQNQINKFAKGISKLNSLEKGKLLELIAQNIFSGCQMKTDSKLNLKPVERHSQSIETGQDTFIKEVILGEARSRNSIGSNIYHPSKDQNNKKGLRMIIIDGSNVAMEHTKGNKFSVKGLKICIDYFVRRGHVVKAFVPRFRCKFGKSTDPKLLDSLERQGLVVYTPSREIQGRICVPYDDRYIVQCAAEFDGIIVSGDNYRDLLKENPRWRFVIENRLLPFTWVDDMIMFPKDPLGRNGPTLNEFLQHPNTTIDV